VKSFILLLLLVGCGKEATDSIVLQRIVDQEPLDSHDIEDLSILFYNQCRSIYAKVPNQKQKAASIEKCLKSAMKPFISEYKEDEK